MDSLAAVQFSSETKCQLYYNKKTSTFSSLLFFLFAKSITHNHLGETGVFVTAIFKEQWLHVMDIYSWLLVMSLMIL